VKRLAVQDLDKVICKAFVLRGCAYSFQKQVKGKLTAVKYFFSLVLQYRYH